MSRVDFFSSSDRSELGEELHQAFFELGLEDVEEVKPTAPDALLSVRFAEAAAGAESGIEARAETLRTTLAALLTGGPDLSFVVAAD